MSNQTTDEPYDRISDSLPEKVNAFADYVFGGTHRLRKLVSEHNHYVCVPHGTLATFDDDRLTRIVVASHVLGMRAEVSNHGLAGLKILLHNRESRSGRMWTRHPGPQDLVHEICKLTLEMVTPNQPAE